MTALARSHCISLLHPSSHSFTPPATLVIMADSMQAVLSALSVFSSAPDKSALDSANAWLQDFQHSVNTFAHGPTRRRL